MDEDMTRREFLVTKVAGSMGLAAASGLADTSSRADSGQSADFGSRWDRTNDRVWPGEEYWSNPLQDWRILGGRLECVRAEADRNVQILTRQLGEGPGELRMSVRIGRTGGGALGEGQGSFGFRVGIQGPLHEYRNNVLFGTGLNAGVTADGRLFVDDVNAAKHGTVDLGRQAIELRFLALPLGDHYEVTLTAADATTGDHLGAYNHGEIAAARMVGNLALVANYPRSDSAPGERGSSAAKGKAGGRPGPWGTFWFSDWRVGGSKVERHDERAFGPILFAQYTLSRRVLKLTAQMPPLGQRDSQNVRLEVRHGQAWTTLAKAPIDSAARTATFRVEGWDDTQNVPYQLSYTHRFADQTTEEHHWSGVVRRDPTQAPVLTVGDVSCNLHSAFPNAAYVAQMTRLDPDLLAFTGDQFYEPSGGYGVQRSPLDAAILDMLRKWYLHGWTWRELMRDRPSISIPDDHDVYQGNIWGEGGAANHGTQESGGYEMPPAWVNVVHRTQTSHHPDCDDPIPIGQGISVYFGSLVYGRISFAILADRQFKSGPEGKVPATGGRGDHVADPGFDSKTADLPGLELLGERQLRFIRTWAADWRGADMKAVISQSPFTAMATTHGRERERLRADYDTNGWPQKARNAAVREIRKAFAFHIAGDQHLPALLHYGVEAHGDAGLAFAGPAVNSIYPRWWEPETPGGNRPAGSDEKLGEFRDSFGHPLTVLAVANPLLRFRPGVLDAERDKAAGLGIVRFDKRNRTIKIECWPFLADVTRAGTQFPGWPVTVSMLDNYARRPAAWLPLLEIEGTEHPVVQVVEERSGEVLYTLRIAGRRFRPHVFATGSYTVRVGEPETSRLKELRGVTALPRHDGTLKVDVSKPDGLW
jgi:alkaline phosphatase D